MRDTSSLNNMRDAIMVAIEDLAAEHPEVVMLDADLSSCIGSSSFQKLYPERFFNCGIAGWRRRRAFFDGACAVRP
jgi:transketolase